jgi:hypothetical protein
MMLKDKVAMIYRTGAGSVAPPPAGFLPRGPSCFSWDGTPRPSAMPDIQTTHRRAGMINIFGHGRGSAILGASNYLRLAATPTFAILALLTGVIGSRRICFAWRRMTCRR